ncbi:metallophosphoesterase (plasmid) [Deltaproteobacteria bacterium Smac51]|nr:metallophosphoesterase [Deltaproteobacteria bacterium Smac51]
MGEKIILLGDIHGNYIAFKDLVAALAPLKPMAWYLLGDALGYFPDGRRVLNLLRRIGGRAIMGNHEDMLLKKSWGEKDCLYRLAAQRGRLSRADLEWISAWPCRRLLELPAGTAFLAHGSPVDHLRGYIYPDSDLAAFRRTGYRYVFCAHTHRPFRASSDGTDFYNVGSVGLPRDGSGHSSCLIWDRSSESGEHFFSPLNMTEIVNEYSRKTHPDVIARLEDGCRNQ